MFGKNLSEADGEDLGPNFLNFSKLTSLGVKFLD